MHTGTATETETETVIKGEGPVHRPDTGAQGVHIAGAEYIHSQLRFAF